MFVFFFAVLKTTGILFGEVLCGIVWLTAGVFVGEVFFAIVKLAAGILVREVFFTIVWLTAGVLVRELFFAIVWLTTGRIRSQDRSIIDASDPPPATSLKRRASHRRCWFETKIARISVCLFVPQLDPG